MENSESKNREKPAYPIRDINEDGHTYIEVGLTKREYFAAMAMKGITSSEGFMLPNDRIKEICRASIRVADELLIQLSK